MFRPIPEAALLRRAPYRLIAAVLLILALVVSVILLFSLEQEKLLLQGVTQGKTVPTDLFPALWQSRRDLTLVALLVFLVSAIGITAVITFLHHDSTLRTLEEVKGLARNILESIPTGVLTLNRSGIITAVNPSAEVVLKRASTDLLGHSYESVFTEGDTIRRALDAALRIHRHMCQKDLPYESRDRTLHTIRVSTAELTGDDGRPAGVILQAQDVTEWLALERRVRVAEKLAALHTLSAGVAHELRNPLSAIDLNLHLLEEEFKEQGGPAKQAAYYLRVLNAECRRLSVILDNFMKFARPGSMGLHAVDLPALIEHIVALMRFEAEERKIQLEQRVSKDMSPVLGDETQISQVLVNIVVNAFHAMPNGGRCCIATEERTEEGNRLVEIVVSDTGIGIEQEDLPRLFEPFYTTKSGGTGLGLAIAYRIMQDHGGTIHVTSVPGNGTQVVMQFPVAVDHQQSVAVGS
ncbi:MAG: PAS domain-containing protein [Nitrospira sp.]|uniref:histidine kinase n=1 Tax=Nitrospira defluvii TaxID=330214 RepID=A0ABM8QTD4_9BACT|nr:ATP-binding protein [Nitrospira defluvii]MCS6327696.1 PAS domain-containing protein [Nitrospira sp.]CAE6714084.1 Putative Sensor histidine kinase [Nitrospira defluvii]